MVKNHLKRLNSPKKWRVKRKGITFITRPLPGPHNMERSLPLNIIIRDILNYAKTTREVKDILNNKAVLVNGIKRQDVKFPVGLFDVLEIKETKEYFRIILDSKGKISLIVTDKSDSEIRPAKIVNKSKIKGKTQINLIDGTNILVDKDEYKTGDTLMLSVPKKEIKNVLKFDKKMMIYLTDGKHIGEIGVIEDIKENKISYKVKDGVFETLKDYVFIIGKDKALIKLQNE